MAIVPKSVDYTDKDFESLNARLTALLRSVFPTWSNVQLANFGNILRELFAFVGDVLGFYQDNQANEAFIATAQQRRSLINLSKLIGFDVPSAVASTVDVTITLPAVTAGDVTFSAGTVCRTTDLVTPTKFQIIDTQVILAGSTSVVCSVEQSENQVDVFEGEGTPSEEFQLGKTPYLDGSAVVSAPDGIYTQAPNNSFLESSSTDKHFILIVDQNDRATLRFGDGVNGAIPSPGFRTVPYKTGGGERGNVEAGTITVLEGQFFDSLSNPISPTITNVNGASGGADRMANSQIRVRAPASLRAVTRTMTRDDYVVNARRLSGVARALMLTNDEDAGIPENTGQLFIVPTGGGVPSGALKTAVLQAVTVDRPGPLTFTVSVLDTPYKTVNVQATVYKATGATGATVKSSIQEALATLFALTVTDAETGDVVDNPSVDFGANYLDADGAVSALLAWSDIHTTIAGAAGVRKLEPNSLLINGSASDLAVLPREFPVLGTVTVIDGDAGVIL